MHTISLDRWRHDHAFGTEAPTIGERRTRWVIALTFVMMVAEIVAGTVFGSMALLADGWHMASHAAALSVSAFAYWFARRHARSERFSFGTGKVGALGGFASAIALALMALFVFVESTKRVVAPVPIHFDQAIGVAALGLVVNLVSAFLLRDEQDHDPELHGHHHDHNLKAAYLHVLADAMTSVFALMALACGKLLAWTWMDPAVGIVGAVVIARWSHGLIRDTGRVLLDAEADPAERDAIRATIEAEHDNRVVDLHLWRVGPRHLAAILAIVTHRPQQPAHYRAMLNGRPELVHVTIEVIACSEADHHDATQEKP
ncbi:MAG TPA: CDF family Co(II)/Ni(II) efflux transporter DmeF [Planctomycetota bacterium]|nr:CDF family Co(II)/Ni(II) efflux transporter DmeF [Planctomycetota bacterium]